MIGQLVVPRTMVYEYVGRIDKIATNYSPFLMGLVISVKLGCGFDRPNQLCSLVYHVGI